MKPRIFIRKAKTLLKLMKGAMRYPAFKRTCIIPEIMTIADTLQLVVDKQLSVARFGDSEYLYMSGGGDGVQASSKKLREKLLEVMRNTHPNLLVCMVNYHDLANRNLNSKLSAMKFHTSTYNAYKPYINFDYRYGNSNMTRFYFGSVDKSRCVEYFSLCKQIWQGREIVVFEGENTRFGYGNDLFDNATSVQRVLCPSKMAFDYYDQILTEATTLDKQKLLIFALGATATAIAGDLTEAGYQIIDIGNLDVEYEWFKLGATKRVSLGHKQVSEVVGGTCVREITDEKYLSQIIGRIGV